MCTLFEGAFGLTEATTCQSFSRKSSEPLDLCLSGPLVLPIYIEDRGIGPLLRYLERKSRLVICIPSYFPAFCKFSLAQLFNFPVCFSLSLCWAILEGRNMVGFAQEWASFFLRFFFVFSSGGSVLIIERCTQSVPVSPALLEYYFAFCTLYNVPYRLFCLPRYTIG